MKQRPVNLNLFTMHFPITALVSITHRISGVLLFFMIPLGLWLLQQSLLNEQTFAMVRGLLSHWLVKFVAWGILTGLFYHLFAGIRHLLMDCHIGETWQGGRQGAKILVVLSVIMAIILFKGFFL